MRGLRGLGIQGLANPVFSVACLSAISVVQNTVNFGAWVTDQIWVETLMPVTNNAGLMNAWVTDQVWLNGQE